MKRTGLSVLLILFGLIAPVLAEDPTTPVNVSTVTPSVALTGETITAPAPRAMTDSSGDGIFVTLTRTAMKRQDLPVNAEIVTPEQFKTYGAQNAGEAVSRLTSIQVKTQGQLGATRLAGIRGATSNQTLVLIDGRPVGGVGLSGSQDLTEIPVEQIDRIEVVRGGVSALYGPNALGGVINVITKRATHIGLPISHVAVEGGSYRRQAYKIDFGSRLGPLDYFFFGDQQMERGFRKNSDGRTSNIGGNLGISMGGAGKILVDAANYHSNIGIPGQLGFSVPDIPVNQYDNQKERISPTPNARQDTNTTYGRASYLVPLPMDFFLTVRGWGSERHVQSVSPDDPFFPSKSDRNERTIGSESQLQLPLGLMVGGTWTRDRLDNRDLISPANSFIAHVENWGIFLQENLAWNVLSVIPSVRYDKNSQAGESTNPRVQTMVEATPWLRISGSAGRSFRAPTLDDLYYPLTDFGFGSSYQGNPNLRPEKAWTYDGGFEVHRDSSSLKAAYFRANVSDLIQTTSDMASTTRNIGTARRQGAELEIRQIPCRFFHHRLNYTYLENRGIPNGFNNYVVLMLSPRHTVNYFTTLSLRKWSVDNTFRYVDSYYEGNNRSGAKMSSVLLWDLRVSYPIRQMDLFVGINDVTDKRYRERSGFPLPGRTFFGGLSLRLWG